MCCFYTFNDLFKKMSCLIFFEVIILYKVIKFSSFCYFHYNKDISCCVEYFIQFNDIGMVDKLQNLDLSFDLVELLVTFEIIFLFFILDLLMILTATLVPVRSCLASKSRKCYI